MAATPFLRFRLRLLNLLRNAIDSHERRLAQRHAVIISCHCEQCGTAILEGDRGYASSDGVEFCEAHAQTYADWQDELTASEKAGADDHDIAGQRAAIQAHLATGGKLTDKLLTTF